MIPVTIIGGYLGAGKTTLINDLLSNWTGEPMAVLVNDFGEINIDASLIESTSADTVTLTNGCVCCSLVDDLGAALEAQVKAVSPPSRIVVEASGVADPASIGIYAQGWPGTRLDAIVSLVDAQTIRAQAKDRFVGRLIESQMAAADLLVINKTDCIEDGELWALQSWLKDRSPDASLLTTSYGRVSSNVLVGPGGARLLEQPDEARLTPVPFTSKVHQWQAPIERAELEAFVEAFPETVVRFKGFVRLTDSPGVVMVVQGVGSRWSALPARVDPPSFLADQESVLVSIGVGPAIS